MAATVAHSSQEQVPALQDKYIELLEKRISQLEAAINRGENTKQDTVEKKGAGDAGDSDDEAEEKGKPDKKDVPSKPEDKPTEQPKASGRYVTARRVWDAGAGSWNTEIIADTTELETTVSKQDEHKDIAYIFRRVLDDPRTFSEIEVVSPELVAVLKRIIDPKYPGINLESEDIYMDAPFPALVHNWDALKREAGRDPEAQVCKDLAHLLNKIEQCEELVGYFKTRDVNRSSRVVTFDTAWTIFAPKDLVVVKTFLGEPQLLQISTSPLLSRAPGRSERLWFDAWCWDFDGASMAKVTYELRLSEFRGTKQISELEYCPLAYYEEPEKLKRLVLERTKKYLDATLFCKQGAGRLRQYNGEAYVMRSNIVSPPSLDESSDATEDDDNGRKGKLVTVKGEIISDAQAFVQYASPNYRIHPLGTITDDSVHVPKDVDSYFYGMTPSDLERKMAESPTPIDLLIVPSRILGWATKEKAWAQFWVDYTSAPEGKRVDKFENELQLDDKYKQLILALVSSHEEGLNQGQIQDITADKGQGLVLLFHGPPGVGKTLTAETIAEATGKPLFVVSVAEVGLDASQAERNLNKLFNLATRWESVLLIDEADVFLETRDEHADVGRNALVSVMLRVLEYYKGIIILTTNRIKTIDIAVISRIHLAIRYDDLAPEHVDKIFRFFLDQLEKRQPTWIKERQEINYFIKKYAQYFNLNGRQIRNVVSSAVATARHKYQTGTGDGKLTVKELEDVLEMTKAFQDDLKEHVRTIRGANEVAGGKRRG